MTLSASRVSRAGSQTWYSLRSRGCRLFVLLFLAGFGGWRAEAASCLPTPSGLVAWWPGDGNTNDIVGTNNGVLVGGATFTGGFNGQAFSFDGTNAYARFPDSPVFKPTNLTIEAWVNFSGLDSAGNAAPAGEQYIVFKQNTRNAAFEGFYLGKTRISSQDKFTFQVSSSGGQAAEVDSVTNITTGTWYHIAGVRGSNFLQLYVNGKLQSTASVTFTQDYGSLPLYFGTSGQSFWDRKLKGALDEVSLYNRALSSNEIAAAFSAGAVGKCKAVSFTTQPQTQTVVAGSNAIFSVATTGLTPISYQWQFNGSSISGATATNLILTSVQGSNAGNYTVVGSNPLGAVTSSVAVLTVITNPVITGQPLSRTNVAGTDASFAVAVSGNGTLGYQWRFNGTNISGATGTSLSVSNVQPANAGAYTVVVTNAAGSATSSVAVLTVWVPPTVTGPPSSRTNVVGTTASFSVSASGTGPLYYQWQFNGVPIGGATDSSLNLNNVQTSSAGNYAVAVTNGAGPVTSSVAVLTIWVPPSISPPPQSRTNIQGTVATFTVSANGTAPFAYQWQFNGVSIPGATASTLSVSNAQPSDAGNYSVVVTNSAGSITSAIAVLTVWVPPTVSSQPQSRTNIQGTTATFDVSASGTSPFSYQWQFNGGALGGATTPTLILSNVQPADAGNYTVVVTNSGGSTTSAVAVLTVWVPPGITAQPISQTNIVGTTANFSVSASGTVPLSYQWQFNGANIANATGTSLSVSNVQTSDGGNYAVVVTNSAGSITSAVAVLTVWVPPTISAQPVSRTNVTGTTATFGASANGTAPFSYQWQFNGANIANATATSLSISNVQTTDAGDYTVVVTNSAGSVTSVVAVLTVWVPPGVIAQPISQTNLVDTTASFSVGASGTEPLSYQWQFNGANIANATGTSLSISNVQTTDGGNYAVVVTNSAGSITSAVAVLTVWVPPTISAQPVSRTNVTGTTATFGASANGTTPFSYQWQFNGGAINGATGASLSVSNVQTSDAGNYSVVVTNSAGSITSAVAVLTVWVPPTISAQPVSRTNVTGTTATFGASADGTTPFSYQWQFNGGAINGATGASLSVSNVQPTDAGNYTIVVTNSAGSITSAIAVLTVWVPPAITLQPQSQTNVQGTTAALLAGVSGTAPLSYQWLFNGLPLSGATSTNLSIGNVQPTNAGNYSIVATNLAGAITSAVAVLTVWVPPGITTQPLSRTNVTGTTASFSASASGTTPFSYQWQFNGGAINGATGTSLSVSNVQPTDAGNYTIVVTNSAGSITSAVAVLTVWVPPTIISQPQSVSAFAGTNVSFGVTAAGTAPFSYQWALNGTTIAGATLATLTVTNILPTNAGNYTVVVTNVASSVTSSPALLTVLGKPIFIAQPASRTNVQGTAASFGATTTGTLPQAFQWRLGGTNLSDGGRILGAASNILTITNVQPVDAGGYTMVASNIVGMATSVVATLTVTIPPSIVNGPASLSVPVGSNATLNVTVAGTLPLSYQWRFNGANLAGATGSTLALTNVQTSNAGSYVVVVTNVAGSITSSVAVLSVVAPSVLWYVDNKATNSANKGTNWANAWTNLNSIVWGNNGVKAGHTLYLSGGSVSKTYTNTWTIGASGVPGSPIHIAINAANSNHNGTVIFDYNYAGDFITNDAIVCLQNYVNFEGNVGGACRLLVANAKNYMDAAQGVGIYADLTTGIVIDHVGFTNCNNPLRLVYGIGFRVSNCSFRGVRGDAAIGAAASIGPWDSNVVYSNYFELLFNTALPPGKTGSFGGPDGVQCSDGISIFGNTFVEVHTTNVFTSDQHPDMVQAAGNYIKVHDNEFINVGDSVFDFDCFSQNDPHDVWIYNNLFRITNAIGSFPSYFRLFTSGAAIASIDNFKIFNNTFADNNNWAVLRFFQYNGNPAGSGNEIKNNIFYNCGFGYDFSIIYIQDSCGFGANSFTFDGNIYYQPASQGYIYYGASYPTWSWVNRFEPRGKTNAPTFARYVPFASTNDFHLSSNDTAAVNAGLDLSAYISTDKDGLARPQGPGWDIGAYEFGALLPLASNSPPSVSIISQNAADVDPAKPGLQTLAGASVIYSTSAADANVDALSWQWRYSANGAAEVLYQSGTGTTANASFTYPAGSAGSAYLWKFRVTDGYSWTETELPVGIVAAARGSGALTFEAESGAITGPFIVSDGAIYQPAASDPFSGGRVVYNVGITTAANYFLQADVDAPGYGQRSLLVNMDAEPTAPGMTWQMAITTNFETRTMTWQGSGGCGVPQFSPLIFNLSPGTHQLIIRGLDASVKLDRISLLPVPSVATLPASGVTYELATLNGSVNPAGTATTVYFQYGPTTNYGKVTSSINAGSGTAAVSIGQLVTSLAQATTYHYRVVAFNSNATVYGADQTFTTTPVPVRQGSQFFYWVNTVPGRVYYLQYKNNLTDPNWSVITNVLGDGTMKLLIDPTASTSPQRFYRIQMVDLPGVSTLDATGITDKNAILNGVVNPMGNAATAYFEFGLTSSYGGKTPAVSMGQGTNSLSISNTLSGLSAQSLYHFRLVAYNGSGTNYGADLIFTTSSSLSLILQRPELKGGKFSFSFLTSGRVHFVEYKSNPLATKWVGLTNLAGGGLMRAGSDLSPLELSHLYRVRVSAGRRERGEIPSISYAC